MLLELEQITVPPGQRILLNDISWSEFEKILEELGDNRGTKVAYRDGILEIMAPLPEREQDKEIIGDLVRVCH